MICIERARSESERWSALFCPEWRWPAVVVTVAPWHVHFLWANAPQPLLRLLARFWRHSFRDEWYQVEVWVRLFNKWNALTGWVGWKLD